MISSNLKVQIGSAAPLGPRAVSPATDIEPTRKDGSNDRQVDAVIMDFFNQSSREIREELAENFLADTYQAYKEGIEKAKRKAEQKRETEARVKQELLQEQQMRGSDTKDTKQAKGRDILRIEDGLEGSDVSSLNSDDVIPEQREAEKRSEVKSDDRTKKLGITSYEKQLQVELSYYQNKEKVQNDDKEKSFGPEKALPRFQQTA